MTIVYKPVYPVGQLKQFINRLFNLLVNWMFHDNSSLQLLKIPLIQLDGNEKQLNIMLDCIKESILPSSAQAQAQLSWAELVLILLYPAPGRPPTWNSSEIAGNKQNLLL